MNDEIEDEIKHREGFVIYDANRGFIKNRRKDFTPKFEDARIFSKKAHASNSVSMSKFENKVHIIPVQMRLDPRKLFTAVLKG